LQTLDWKMARAAQEVYDEWDEEALGGGGICDQVSEAMAGVIVSEIEDIEIDEGGQEGDDHSWVVVTGANGSVFGVDISPYIYERGGGYNWVKIPDVTIKAKDVCIWKIA
jgi:hypothetical protein